MVFGTACARVEVVPHLMVVVPGVVGVAAFAEAGDAAAEVVAGVEPCRCLTGDQERLRVWISRAGVANAAEAPTPGGLVRIQDRI